MNLVFSIIFILTSIFIIIEDLKAQKIFVPLILVNYCSFCMIINPILLIGAGFILLFKKLKKPVDIIYIITIGFTFLYHNTQYDIISVIPLLIQTIISKKDKISFMVSIEIACIILLILRRDLII